MATTVKTSVSLQKPLWHLLKNTSNKSRIINDALEMYFDKQEFLQEAKKRYWATVEKSLSGGNNEYISLNPKNEVIDQEVLNKTLWS